MKIGIIGCGYVGQAVAKHLKALGHTISATTRSKERNELLKFIVDHVYDLSEGSLEEFCAKQEILIITVAPDHHSDYHSTYLETAKKILGISERLPCLKQLIYTGSTSVYGDCNGEWVNEDSACYPLTENGQILLETENLLLKCHSHTINTCILRLGEIYGPGREIEERLRRMHHTPFSGTGESMTNLIHLDDIVRAIGFALNQSLNGVYNLCSDLHLPRRLFYEQLCKKENIPPIKWDPTRLSPHGGNRKVSNEKIKTAGFSFNHPSY